MIATVNGVEIFYDIEGMGLPCFLLHGGLGLDHTYFKPWFSAISDVCQLVYIDQRGNGRSSKGIPETYTHENFTKDVEELRKHLDFNKVVLIGHSYGGFIALEYAVRHSLNLSALILISTAPSGKVQERALKTITKIGNPEQINAFYRFASGVIDSDEEFKHVLEILQPLNFHNPPPDLFLSATKNMILSAQVSAHVNTRELPRYDLTNQLGLIHVPTLVTVGQYDWITTPEDAQHIAKSIAHSKLVIFRNSGHFAFVEEPKKFQAVLRDFLSHLRSHL